jgi:FlaA1/EpsC-like NDP-sugar epimerase
MTLLEGKRILVTGGTGSLGKVLVRRLLSGEQGTPRKVVVFSRDEAKQHDMRLQYAHASSATDEVIYRNFERVLEFRVGDVRIFDSVVSAARDADIVVNAAAMKQVPTCEYFPLEAVATNVLGAENLVRAIEQFRLPVEAVVAVSTDKACKPVNVMGMTKALQERVFVQANMRVPQTRFICVRYGNVLASRGSVIPLFHEQIRRGGPVTITTEEMTRFLLTLDQAVDTIFAALAGAAPGETYVPMVPSARMTCVAQALVGDRRIETVLTGIRPGEKVHEIMVSEDEVHRTVQRGRWYVILPLLPELAGDRDGERTLSHEYSSADNLLSLEDTVALLRARRLMVDDVNPAAGELLR